MATVSGVEMCTTSPESSVSKPLNVPIIKLEAVPPKHPLISKGKGLSPVKPESLGVILNVAPASKIHWIMCSRERDVAVAAATMAVEACCISMGA